MPVYCGTDAGGSLPHGLVAQEVARAARRRAAAAGRAGGGDLVGPRPGWAATGLDRGRQSADLVVYPADPREDLAVLAQPRRRRPAWSHVLSARGERVHVRPVAPQDVEPFRAAVAASNERISRWNPVDPERIQLDLADQSPTRRTLMIVANDPAGSHGLVGRVNVSNVVRGTFQSASMGYDAYDPYAGRGLFREGLGLVVDLAFRVRGRGRARPAPGRGERAAGQQPVRGRAAVAGLPARGRDAADALAGRSGRARLARPRAVRGDDRGVAGARRTRRTAGRAGWSWSTACPGSGKSTLAARAGRRAGAAAAVQGRGRRRRWPTGCRRVTWPGSAGRARCWAPARSRRSGRCWPAARPARCVESWWAQGYADLARTGLQSAGVDPASVVEVWCDWRPSWPARGSSARRRAAPVHGPQWAWRPGTVAAVRGPLSLGRALRHPPAAQPRPSPARPRRPRPHPLSLLHPRPLCSPRPLRRPSDRPGVSNGLSRRTRGSAWSWGGPGSGRMVRRTRW